MVLRRLHPWGPLEITKELDGEGVLRWNSEPRDVYYVHICQPLHERDGALAWIDLELDVIRNPDGSVVVIDHEEFESLVAAGLPAAVEAEARAACDQVARMLRARTEPFGVVGARWLARFLSGEFS